MSMYILPGSYNCKNTFIGVYIYDGNYSRYTVQNEVRVTVFETNIYSRIKLLEIFSHAPTMLMINGEYYVDFLKRVNKLYKNKCFKYNRVFDGVFE